MDQFLLWVHPVVQAIALLPGLPVEGARPLGQCGHVIVDCRRLWLLCDA